MSDTGADVTTGDKDAVTHTLSEEDAVTHALADKHSDGLGVIDALEVTAPDDVALRDTLSVALAHTVLLVL